MTACTGGANITSEGGQVARYSVQSVALTMLSEHQTHGLLGHRFVLRYLQQVLRRLPPRDINDSVAANFCLLPRVEFERYKNTIEYYNSWIVDFWFQYKGAAPFNEQGEVSMLLGGGGRRKKDAAYSY